MAAYGWQWLAKAGYGCLWPALGYGWKWLPMASYAWQWLAMAGSTWLAWPARLAAARLAEGRLGGEDPLVLGDGVRLSIPLTAY